MKVKDLLKMVEPHCKSITHNGKHYKATLPNGRVITISGTPSDQNYFKHVFRDFKRNNIIINDTKKSKNS